MAYLLTTDFIEHVFSWYPEIDNIYARIKPNNIASINAAKLSGFTLDEDGRYVYSRTINKMKK